MNRLGLALLVGCGPVPAHLRPPDPTANTAILLPSDAAGLPAILVQTDPLVRRLPALDAALVRALPGGEPYAELLDLTASAQVSERGTLARLESLEISSAGTPIVAMSRGARLREVEALVGGEGATDERALEVVLDLISPLDRSDRSRGLGLRPLHWLDQPGARRPILDAADRWVLSGWLDGPAIDVEPAARALRAGPHENLRATPVGQLILDRAAGVRAPDPEGGWRALRRASELYLAFAVRDRDAEQTSLAATRTALRDELGPGDPVGILLDRAFLALTEDAGRDRSAGGALLALHARRLVANCEPQPCVGIDRLTSLRAAGRWDPETGRLARLFVVGSLEEALDGLEVAAGTARYPAVTVDLVDALLGAGALPPDPIVLQQRSPDAATWLALGRSVGAEQTTTQAEAIAAMRRFLAQAAAEAATPEPPGPVRDDLMRVARTP